MARSAPFPSPTHDHRACLRRGLKAAERLCRAKGARLTPVRRRVLELILDRHQPIGAYDLIDRLAEEGPRPAPPTVYRALDFLRTVGLVHRIESRNAYVGCPNPARPHTGSILICRTCDRVAETGDPALARALARNAARLGFSVERSMIEIQGVCPACQRDASR
ncbi:MAG: transcriptional repressor [Rhodospirillales bacterium]|nr:transcriptional repressor [Rhodospirillales bacterium]